MGFRVLGLGFRGLGFDWFESLEVPLLALRHVNAVGTPLGEGVFELKNLKPKTPNNTPSSEKSAIAGERHAQSPSALEYGVLEFRI